MATNWLERLQVEANAGLCMPVAEEPNPVHYVAQVTPANLSIRCSSTAAFTIRTSTPEINHLSLLHAADPFSDDHLIEDGS